MPAGMTGHVRAPNKDFLITLSARRHKRALQLLLATPPPPTWDSRTHGWIGPIKDQQQCGSCWDFSGTGMVEVAYYKAGLLKPDGSDALSEEYTLSCGRNGGCNGDDNVTVLQWAKSTGLPKTSDYGPYNARAGQCAFKPAMTLYKIDDWGFCDGSGGNGVAPTDAIKAAIMQYGCVGSAVAAGGDQFWNSGQGVGTGRSHSIDHDVIIVGWDDSKGNGGAWLMRNSWGTQWGSENGCAWVQYGAYDPAPRPCGARSTPAPRPSTGAISSRKEAGREEVSAYFPGSAAADRLPSPCWASRSAPQCPEGAGGPCLGGDGPTAVESWSLRDPGLYLRLQRRGCLHMRHSPGEAGSLRHPRLPLWLPAGRHLHLREGEGGRLPFLPDGVRPGGKGEQAAPAVRRWAH